jgi:hypothetical protein
MAANNAKAKMIVVFILGNRLTFEAGYSTELKLVFSISMVFMYYKTVALEEAFS